MALICDTGAVYAAMDRADPDHGRCTELLAESVERLVIPAPVLVEVGWLAASRLGPAPFATLLSDVGEGTLQVEDLELSDYARIRELVDQYSDLPLGFVDAAVLAVVERLKETKLATLDHRHFHVLRPRHIASLALLPA